MRTMEWQPTSELIDWGNEHFAKIPIDGVWAPDDSGVQYRKMTETSFALIFMLNHPMAQDHLSGAQVSVSKDWSALDFESTENRTPRTEGTLIKDADVHEREHRRVVAQPILALQRCLARYDNNILGTFF